MVNKCLYLGIKNICVIDEYLEVDNTDEFGICNIDKYLKCNKYEVNK